ncbi:hypothetical protein Tco_0740104, partial [Tanacetum coccineum]
MDSRVQQSRDHDTTSAGVNIIGGVIISVSSDRTSNTIATEFGTTFEIFEARGGAVTMKIRVVDNSFGSCDVDAVPKPRIPMVQII